MQQRTLGGSTVKEEKRGAALFELLARVFDTPTATGLAGDDGSSSIDLNEKALTQRMTRLMEIAETREEITKQTEKELFRLTDAEKLAILSNLSLRGPLDHEFFEEMQRLFLAVKGEKKYREVFGDEDPRPPPMYDLWKGK